MTATTKTNRRTTTAHKATTHKTTAHKTTAHKPAAKTHAKADGFAHTTKKKGPAQTEAAAAVKPVHEYPADPKTPPALTGKISLENGRVYLDSKAGKFEVVNTNGAMNDSTHFFSASDVQAFNGRVVTVRGWPTEGWQTGQKGGVLAVEEWSPGNSPDFVSGRVKVSGDSVVISIRPDKQVVVDDPKLKAALKNYDALGVVLPGEVEKKGDTWHFKGAPADYYVLAGFSATWGTEQRRGDTVSFNMQLAHGKTLTCHVPATHWDQGHRQQRHYFFGHIDGGQFKAKGFTPSAGGWNTAGGGAAGPNAAFRSMVQKAAGQKVDGDARFEL
jgi:hypothetical protein